MSSIKETKTIVESVLRDYPFPGNASAKEWVELYFRIVPGRLLSPLDLRQALTEGKSYGWSLLLQQGIDRHKMAFPNITYEKAIELILDAFRVAYHATLNEIPWSNIPPNPILSAVELYPETDDPKFHEILYWKREFHHKKSDFRGKTAEAMCSSDRPLELFPYQKFLRNFFSPNTPYQGLLLFHMPGSGKCHAKDAPILMYDGTVKLVQNIRVGEFLMGDDSTPRRVISLARGVDDMYDIVNEKGESYRVNQEHILCLRQPRVTYRYHAASDTHIIWYFNFVRGRLYAKFFKNAAEATAFRDAITLENRDRVFEIPVKKYLRLNKGSQQSLKGYRTGVNFASKPMPFDPYILGYWLREGSSVDTYFTIPHSAVASYMTTAVDPYDLRLDALGTPNDYQLIKKTTSMQTNMFRQLLRQWNLLEGERYIPAEVLTNDRTTRLELLAGILDAAGEVVNGIGYRYVTPLPRLAADVLFLVRSLGFVAYRKEVESETGALEYVVEVSGSGLEAIPVKVAEMVVSSESVELDPLLNNIVVKYVGRGDYYGFTLDGNQRYVMGDFTVTHNTCTAITIAEQFRSVLSSNVGAQRRALVLAPGTAIIENFKTQLHNPKKAELEKEKGLPSGALQCTGNTYTNPQPGFYDDFYELTSLQMFRNNYLELRNNVKRYLPSDDKDLIDEKWREEIRRQYSNRIIIVDEVHKLRQNLEEDANVDPMTANVKSYMALLDVLQTAENVRLLLMTATPVFDKVTDIVDIFNLLLANERRPLIDAKDIFSKLGDGQIDWEFREEGPKILAEMSRRFVSYVRGENPITYPRIVEVTNPAVRKELPMVRTYVPKITRDFIRGQTIPATNRLTSQLVLVYCPMSRFEYEHLEDTLRSKKDTAAMADGWGGIGANNPASSLIAYPTGNSSSAFHQCFRRIREKGSHGENQFDYYPEHRGFLRDIAKYSAKYSTMLPTLVHGKGIHFVSPQYNELGVYTIAMLLDENGFENVFGSPYLASARTPPDQKQCALCPLRQGQHKNANHAFVQAKYAVFDREVPNAAQNYQKQILDLTRSPDNVHGEKLKIILASPVSNEGVDYANIRHVHILSPWWNLSRIAQIIGRAARSCSHVHLSEKERRVVVYRYCAAPPEDEAVDRETPDEWTWRMAFIKDRMIKNVERILKENSIDCYLNKELNQAAVDRGSDHGRRACEYTQCDYQCHFEPKGKRELNHDTEVRVEEHDQVRQAMYYISQLFRRKDVYLLSDIEAEIAKMDPQMEKIWIYTALDQLVAHMTGHAQHGTTLYDQHGREGFLQYVRQHYVFLPLQFSPQPRTPLHVRRQLVSPPKQRVILSAPAHYRKEEAHDGKKKPGPPWSEWKAEESPAWWENSRKTMRAGELHRTIEKAPIAVRIALVEWAIENEWFPDAVVSFFRFEWIHRVAGKEDQLGWTPSLGTKTLLGHLLGTQPRCYDRTKKAWVFCPPMLRQWSEHRSRVLTNETMDLHLAYVDNAGVLKLVDRDVEKKKVDRIEGKTCKTFRMQRIHEIREVFGFPPLAVQSMIDHCDDLELWLRERQIQYDLKGSSVRCFYQDAQWVRFRELRKKPAVQKQK